MSLATVLPHVPIEQTGVAPEQGPPVVPQWHSPLEVQVSTFDPVQAAVVAEHLQTFAEASQ